MKKHRKRGFIGLVLALLLSASHPIIGSNLPVIRISVENTGAHVQAKSVEHFASLLASRLEGQYTVQFYPAASLFRDADVFRALAQGKVEIAVPGSWQFDRYVPEVGVFLLPSLYGRDASFTYGLMESAIGRQIVSTIERVLDVKVFGRWIDLGHTHVFSKDSTITRPADFLDKQIRVAGGIGNALRIESLGAKAVNIAWPDFPEALNRGVVDGVLTSYETIASAKLWEQGINAVYEDRQYFAQYVPIASGLFWDRLSQETKQIIETTWDEIVDKARRDAAVAQAAARATLMRQGVAITRVGTTQLEQTRAMLITDESSIADSIGIPSALYSEFLRYIGDPDSQEFDNLQ